MKHGRVAIVVKGYPRLSETFIAQEILGLERRGLDCLIVSLRHPTDPVTHDIHRAITAPVLYLPEYLKDDPHRVRRGRAAAARLPGHGSAETLFRCDLARDPSAGRRRRWGQAAVLAAELPEDVHTLYVHYLHTPASVARYAAAMRSLPFAFSAHAKDIWTTPEWELREKIADAAWGTTCTAANARYLNGLANRPDKVALVYHGLDLSPFPGASRPRGRTGAVNILSVCRAVEKKGLDDLLRALARLPPDLHWRFEHIGGGGTERLTALASRLGIADRVAFLGARGRDDVIAAYQRADIFALASRVARDGDRDGLPNVIMEAMAMARPVVSTTVSAVPEIVTPETGVLVAPRNPPALASAIAALARDPAMRARLGAAGAERVRTHFSPAPGLDLIAERLDALGAHHAA